MEDSDCQVDDDAEDDDAHVIKNKNMNDLQLKGHRFQ
jgi:hypothetical protein